MGLPKVLASLNDIEKVNGDDGRLVLHLVLLPPRRRPRRTSPRLVRLLLLLGRPPCRCLHCRRRTSGRRRLGPSLSSCSRCPRSPRCPSRRSSSSSSPFVSPTCERPSR